MNNLNSIATSVLKNMRFPQASRSIASNAENGVRFANTKENFANTATSARGKKRTHGLVFDTNHKNPNGQYKYYYRSQRYARKNANVSNDDTNMNENGPIIYKKNPMTRQTGRILLARYSNATRKALFERAVADKNVSEIVRLIDARYVPSRQLATNAIRAMACLPNGLEGVQRILNLRVRFYANEMNDMYAAVVTRSRGIVTCSRDRAEALIKAFMKANIVPASTPPNNRALLDVIDWGLENGLAPQNLKKLVKHALRKDDYNHVDTPPAIDRILAAVLGLQAKRHPNGRMPRALKEFVLSFGGRRNSLLYYLLTSRPRPARIVRWLVEDAHLRMNMDDVLAALRFRHLQIAIFLASKGQWTDADKSTLAAYLERSNSFSKNARKPRFDRILRDMVGLGPAPRRRNSSFNDPYTPVVDVSSLRNGNIVFYGRQNTYPPKRVRVQRISEDVVLLNHRDPRLPPNRISSQANLNKWQREHGIIRGKTRKAFAQGTYVGKNPLVPPPSNARNRNNYAYVKANAAARRIQGAYKSYKLMKKERASLGV